MKHTFSLKSDGENQGDGYLLPFDRIGIRENSRVSRATAVDDETEQLGEMRRKKSDRTKSSYTSCASESPVISGSFGCEYVILTTSVDPVMHMVQLN